MTEAQAISVLQAIMPPQARAVCARLRDAGYQAFAVGGAVRDAILGRAPGDWDVATDATPDQVMRIFERTIPTGVEHGTVTVLSGRGDQRLAVEVTTFRGEGAYSDGRRPDSVTFGVPLHEDLARRDFVINAMAYDPIAGELADPFGGRVDIENRRVRAVGDAAERFAEDGLRVMRAVRFAAVLDFQLDPATEAAIPGALPVLARVSRERVRDELRGLLAASRPSRGLDIARRTGIVHAILPELDLPAAPSAPEHSDPRETRWQRMLARVDAVRADAHTSPVAVIRLAAMLCDIPATALPATHRPEHPLRRLRLSNQEIAAVDRLLAAGLASQLGDLSDTALRALLGRLGREHVNDLFALWRADAQARPDMTERISSMLARAEHILERGDALCARDLAISGGTLIDKLGMRPGPLIGRITRLLLEHVLAEPELNTEERLLELARELYRELSGQDL